jgi:glutathione synthase/RimK-type ligase-like ATP-grasp enzyme
MRVAILKCARLPKFVTWEVPNLDEYFADERLLAAAFAELGAEAEIVAWSDPAIDWGRYDLALVRSTWDYIDDPAGFLGLLARIEAASCRVLNPLAAIRWNVDKAYLVELAGRGVPVVPTRLASSASPEDLQAWVLAGGRAAAVIKPRIGGGACGVRRVAAAEVARELRLDMAAAPGGDFLVQPLVESVLEEGEYMYVFVGDALTHVLLKKPAPGDFRAHGIYGGSTDPATPAAADARQAAAILAALPHEPLYARLDLVRVDGRLAVMEAEVVDPILYFQNAPDGARRLAAAALGRLARGR